MPVPPDRDLVALAQRLRGVSVPAGLATPAVPSVGEHEDFWLLELGGPRVYRTVAELRLVSPRALWYVEAGATVGDRALETAARAFEEQIYPRITADFGEPSLAPGERITVLHARLGGAGGYFSSGDRVPAAVQPFSNERAMVYINAGGSIVGSRGYLSTLAHEFQHLVHDDADDGEESWVNEGLSELATGVSGYPTPLSARPLPSPPVSLTAWPDSPGSTLPYYLTSLLFFHYLAEHHGGTEDMHRLLARPEDGAAGVDGYLRELSLDVTFVEVYRDWTAALLLGPEGRGRYASSAVAAPLTPRRYLAPGQEETGAAQPFAPVYVALDTGQEPSILRFQGEGAVPLDPRGRPQRRLLLVEQPRRLHPHEPPAERRPARRRGRDVGVPPLARHRGGLGLRLRHRLPRRRRYLARPRGRPHVGPRPPSAAPTGPATPARPAAGCRSAST